MAQIKAKRKATPKTKPRLKKEWFVYMIETKNGMLYTGISKDVLRRFQEHRDSKKGAKFFRRSPPKKVLFTEGAFTLSKALKRERVIKGLTREEKLELHFASKIN